MKNELTVTDGEPQQVAGWRGSLEKALPAIEDLLPEHVSIDRFKRITANAIVNTPLLRRAMLENPHIVINELVKCATDGLVPDGREAALVPFNSKDGIVITYMPMRRGVVKLIRQYPGVAGCRTRIVYENDFFEIEGGDTERYVHKPVTTGSRGDPVGVYAIIEWTSGYIDREWVTKEEVLKVKSVAKGTGKAIWEGKFGLEMWRKTVLKKIAKSCDLSADINRMLERDDDLYDMSKQEIERPSVADRLWADRKAQESVEALPAPEAEEVDVVDVGAPDEAPEVIEAEIVAPEAKTGPHPGVKIAQDLLTVLRASPHEVGFDVTLEAAINDGRVADIEGAGEEITQRFNAAVDEARDGVKAKTENQEKD